MKAFWRLLAGCSTCDLAWLFGREQLMCNNLYIFDDPEAEAYHPSIGQVPWPVTLMLGTHSRKHISLQRRVPQPNKYFASFINAEQQLRRRDTTGIYTQLWWKFSWGQSRFHSNFRGSVARDMHHFALQVREGLSHALKSSLALGSKRNYATQPNYFFFGSSWLTLNGWVAVETDKDGGYCLVQRSLLERMHEDTMRELLYTEIGSWSVLPVEESRQ